MNIQPGKSSCQPQEQNFFDIYSVIDNTRGVAVCHGRTYTAPSGYRLIEVLCPFCRTEEGDHVFHVHGWSAGTTPRLSHCNPNRYERRQYLITAEAQS